MPLKPLKKKEDHSIFTIPKFEIIRIKDEPFFFNQSFQDGALGTSLFLTRLLEEFNRQNTTATIYLYGKGVISNEYSKNFNYPESRPDLLLCKDAIKPVVLIDVKFNSIEVHPTNHDDNFQEFIKETFTKHDDKKLCLCNIDEIDGYLTEAKKIDCPIFIVKVIKLYYKKTKETKYHIVGVEVEESYKKLKVKETGKPKKEVYMLDFENWLDEEDLFKKIKELF